MKTLHIRHLTLSIDTIIRTNASPVRDDSNTCSTRRITLDDADTMDYKVTVDDLIYYPHPWKNTWHPLKTIYFNNQSSFQYSSSNSPLQVSRTGL